MCTGGKGMLIATICGDAASGGPDGTSAHSLGLHIAPFRWTVCGFRTSLTVVVCKRSSRRPPRRARGPRSAGGEGRVSLFEAPACGSWRDSVRRAARRRSNTFGETSPIDE
jgi:hypothetical protein